MMNGYEGPLSDNAQLALDTILQKPVKGIPNWLYHTMQHDQIERIAGAEEGAYEREPERVYLDFQLKSGTCMIDQFIPLNPLKMGNRGFKEDAQRGATTGKKEIILNDMRIDSPEAVVEHMEKYIFPSLEAAAGTFDEEARVKQIIAQENKVQEIFGGRILKGGYGYIPFPGFRYGTYGYENYFMAYALYEDVMEKDFSLQADLFTCYNRAAARAFREGSLAPIYRLDHDMADSRGTLVDIRSLDRIWFPHFARCLAPVLATGLKMIWHCDGNLAQMVPRLLDVGLKGFQGFQYEDGMDYEKICRMKTRDGQDLLLIAGVSVTRTLPFGTPEDVRREMRWLVDNGPKTGLFLGCTSSITPGVPWENLMALVEGFRYYREHGRG